MESLTDYGHSGIDNGTKAHHFLQDIKSPELETAVNVVCAQPEQYGTDFVATVSYLDQMIKLHNLSKLQKPEVSW